ncbi:hypothetical protein HF086_015554 [Spodoptera exigua]|uniref:Kinase n=1 Tax=Spodoptera exigua TaxID=7107 RepID=A0A922MF27_SPOEX|nr:hypothetical protein HF086_015554 [Spodoptera exigua]
MKPIIKESQKREVDFYEHLKSSTQAELLELRGLVAKYFGNRKYTYNGFEQDYIILEDLTERMLEPCIMDVKIGKRTWDPLATEEKIKNEQSKYAACKQQYGFCIPGFQVYRLSTGKLCKARVGCRPASVPRRRHSLHSVGSGSNFSGQISSKGPVYKKLQSVPLSPMSHSSFSPPPPIKSPWSEALASFNHNHSFEHNYENKLSKIKMNYRAMLDQLSYDSPTPNPWGTVKIIDFAHAFFNGDEEKQIDENFREGIDNFVEIFECFLRETDDQVL